MTQTTTGSPAAAARSAPVLQVIDLSVTFPSAGGDVTAVRGVSLEVNRGEVLGIVGESGSGKSVTALAVMGLLPSNARVNGSAQLHGQEILGLGEKALSKVRGSTMSMVFQDPLSALTPVYTVGAQLAEAVLIHNDVSKQAANARAVELLDLVGIPHPAVRAKAFPHEFSGGMRQRVMIAMAVANDPDLIICDEPTTALDVTIQAQVLEVLKNAQEVTGAAILMITHDLGVVAGSADRMLVLYAGKTVEVGDVDDIYYRSRMPYTMGLLGSIPRVDEREKAPLVPIEGHPPSLVNLPAGCPFVPRCPMAVDICRQTEPPLLSVATPGHVAACHRADEIERDGLTPTEVYPLPEIPAVPAARVPRQERARVLAVENLVKHYPLLQGAVFKRQVATVHAVDGISFDVREGETLGIVGESGCGKTTTLLEILQLTPPQAGEIVVLGEETSRIGGRDRKRLRRDLQVIFQDPLAALDPRLPVSDILAEPLRTHGVSKDKVGARVRELLQLVGLELGHANRYPQDFSGGQQQRIGIARALALEPKLVVLDEPVSALDVSIRAGIINLLEELKARLGLSYLFVAHDLSVVRHIADRVAVMYLGKIVEVGEVDRVFAVPAHPYTQALLSAIPIPDPHKERQRCRTLLHGDPPSAADPPSGCRFRARCPKFAVLSEGERQVCINQEPPLLAIQADHRAACHYAEKLGI